MPIWRIAPAPRDLTPARLGYGMWAEVIVRASSAARARVVAAAELGDRAKSIGNESGTGRAGLEDEKLYHVARLDGGTGRYAADKRREGVLKADWRKPAG